MTHGPVSHCYCLAHSAMCLLPLPSSSEDVYLSAGRAASECPNDSRCRVLVPDRGVIRTDPRCNTMLSRVVGTAALIPAALAYLTRRHVPLPVTLILAHFAAAGFAVALAASDRFAGSSTAILGKQPTGAVAWWGWGLFWPYHLALQTKLWIQRQYSVEPVWNQILDGWCVFPAAEHDSETTILLLPTPMKSRWVATS